jgi:dipeptidyl aminopeptidase/acylaminoacyl peptidase
MIEGTAFAWARGDVFVTSVEGGVTKRVTTTPEEERGVGFSPDGKALVYASERGGRWAVYEARRARDEEPHFYACTLVKETPLIANAQQNTQPRYSPDGKEIAYIEDRNTLKILNLESKLARTLLTEKEIFAGGGGHHFLWSPDSKWLLFDYSIPGIAPGEVGIVGADGKRAPANLTLSGFDDARARGSSPARRCCGSATATASSRWCRAGRLRCLRDVLHEGAWDRFRLTKKSTRW